MGRDQFAQTADIGSGGEFKADFPQTGEPQLQLTVQIHKACCFPGESLDFAVGKGGHVYFLSCNALDIDGNDPLVCEDNAVSDSLERLNDLFAGNQKRSNLVSENFAAYRCHFDECCVAEIDHGPLSCP